LRKAKGCPLHSQRVSQVEQDIASRRTPVSVFVSSTGEFEFSLTWPIRIPKFRLDYDARRLNALAVSIAWHSIARVISWAKEQFYMHGMQKIQKRKTKQVNKQTNTHTYK